MFEFDPTLSTAVERGVEAGQPAPAPDGPLSGDRLARMQRYWQAANYLTAGQIYLGDNPLLREPLVAAHIKPRLLGHWGTSGGQNFIYVHVNRLITERGARAIYISGPGHGFVRGPSSPLDHPTVLLEYLSAGTSLYFRDNRSFDESPALW